ncbi:MAG: CBS and ACT domain-containing protein [Chloroflexota bacterium]
MLVKGRMSYPVVIVKPDMPIMDAQSLMRKEKVRRFPVVDARGKLVGIVTEKDILHASPSDATSLSIWEINYLLSKVTVGDVMTKDVITITEDTPLEDAARTMVDNKIGGLPVVRNGKVVGIITDTDLFKIFLELLGARESGVRISAMVPDVPGELVRLTKAIFDAGGNIIALGTFLGESSDTREVTIKIQGVTPEILKKSIGPHVERIVDMRGGSSS